MNELVWYEPGSAALSLAPNEAGGPLLLEISGEARSVDAALDYIMRLWALLPCSVTEWVTLDGLAPQEDEPCKARLLVRLSDKVHELGLRPGAGTAGDDSRNQVS